MINPRNHNFCLIATDQGSFIHNRADCAPGNFGVGAQLWCGGSYEPQEIDLCKEILMVLRDQRGDGIIAVDCGANIGVMTVQWAKFMTGWGGVLALEAQERLYYALCGNIALNNVANATAYNVAANDYAGEMQIPVIDYTVPTSFGSISLKSTIPTEDIGQEIDYSKTVTVQAVTIDAIKLDRLDFLKIDIEGMEYEALIGAANTIMRSKPVLVVECVKTQEAKIKLFLETYGYVYFKLNMNVLAVHESDTAIVEYLINHQHNQE